MIILILVMFAHAAFVNKERRRDIIILSAGSFLAAYADLFSVLVDPLYRWLMISAGVFSVSSLTILYVSKKNDLFGLLTLEKRERAKLVEHLEFQKRLLTLVSHDLSGNIRNQARIAQVLKSKFQERGEDEIFETFAKSSQASDELIGNIMAWSKSQEGDLDP
ncbi:MAG: hypothetical protein EOP04_18070, partial [Proteobacteria bacterium]